MKSIVFIPGLLSTGEVFTPQLRALWVHGSLHIASTIEGNTIAEMATSILSNAPPRFALVGLSMGGYISFEILRQAPERVEKVALLSTLPGPEAPDQIARRRALSSQARSDFDMFLDHAFPALLHPSRRKDQSLRDLYMQMGRSVGVEHMVRQNEAIIGRADSQATLKNITVPALVVVGDSDPLTPVQLARDMASAIPGSQLVVGLECGHGVTIEQPELVNASLIQWMKR